MTWRGQWIWINGERAPRNAYVHFRRKLNLPHVPPRAVAWITADSRYIFWVNGALICRGPSRCDPRWQSFDEVDIAPHLREGENSLAVLVHHYGESTFSYIQGRAGLLFECSALNLWSDRDWRARDCGEWFGDLSRMRIQLDYPEVFDARREPLGWTEPGFDDSRWSPATVIGPAGCAPWTSLEKREIPFLREEETGGVVVVNSGETEAVDPIEVIDLQSFYRTDQAMTGHQVAYVITHIESAAAQNVRLDLATAEALKGWVNGQLILPALIHGRQTVTVPLQQGWNRLMLKVLQGQHHWKFACRFHGAADKMPRAALPPAAGQAPQPGWAASGPYRWVHGEDLKATLDQPFPPERGDDGPDVKGCQWLGDPRGSERAVAMLMEFAPHRPGLQLAKDLPVTLGAREYVVLDFGREVVGFPRLKLRAPAGAVLDIGYAECLSDGVTKPNYSETACADRLITRAGAQTWEPFEKRAFRYLQIDCRKAGDAIVVEEAGVRATTYPVEPRGKFECSDDALNRIWQTGAETVRLCMEDAYTDCPWRERAMWWGDARVQFLVNTVAFGDAALMRRGLRLIAQSQDEEGQLAGVYPTTFPNRFLPSFSLLWIVSLWDYYWMTGDDALVRELYPKVQLALKWFSRHVSPNKLLAGAPGWAFVDWAPLDQRGEQAALNACYARALELAGAMSEIVNARPMAIRYRAQSREVKAAFNRLFWSEERRAFADCRVADELSGIVSQQINALAVVFDIASPAHQQIVLDTVCGGEPLVDPNGIVPTGTPHFGFYLLSALRCAGRHGFALDYLRSRWLKMMAAGATTWWERWAPEGSWCHGWSAGPTYDLTTHVLGVQATAAGWREFEVRPRPCGLEWARGVVPTPHGEINVEWQVVDGRCKTTVRAPTGLKFRVVPPASVL